MPRCQREEIKDILSSPLEYRGGHSQYILVGVCHRTSKRGGLRHIHNPKKGSLRHGHESKKGVLGMGTSRKRGILRTGLAKKDNLSN